MPKPFNFLYVTEWVNHKQKLLSEYQKFYCRICYCPVRVVINKPEIDFSRSRRIIKQNIQYLWISK